MKDKVREGKGQTKYEPEWEENVIFSSGVPWIPGESEAQKMWQITSNFTKSKRREQIDMGNEALFSQISDSLICTKDK